MTRPWCAGWVFLWLILIGPQGPTYSDADCPTAREMSDAFSAAATGSMPAVVSIRVEKTIELAAPSPGDPALNDPLAPYNDDLLRRFFGDRWPPQQRTPRRFLQRGQGSGFIISPDGYILTNHHVVEGADRITVELKDGRRIPKARIVGTDPESEVALIKVDAENLPVLPRGDSDKIRVGDWVIAIGNPFGLHETVTVGVISAVGRSNVHVAAYEDFIQTDAPMNPGNSGGPLIDLDGRVIGINTAIVSESGDYMGIGFAIPINMAREVGEQLKQNGRVIRGYLGLSGQDLTEEMAGLLRVKERRGVILTSVERGSPAARAGLAPRDVILTLDGSRVESYEALRSQTAALKPGTRIHLRVFRDGRTQDVEITLIERPSEQTGARPKTSPPRETMTLGLEVRNLTRDLAEPFGYAPGEGVIVVSAAPEGSGAIAGIAAGDLILSVGRDTVNSVEEFDKAIKAATKGPVLLLIQRGDSSQFVVVPLTAP